MHPAPSPMFVAQNVYKQQPPLLIRQRGRRRHASRLPDRVIKTRTRLSPLVNSAVTVQPFADQSGYIRPPAPPPPPTPALSHDAYPPKGRALQRYGAAAGGNAAETPAVGPEYVGAHRHCGRCAPRTCPCSGGRLRRITQPSQVREGTVDPMLESGRPVGVATSDISQNPQVAATGTLSPSPSSTPMRRWPRYPPAPDNAVLCRQRGRPPENPKGAATSVEPPLPAARAETSRGTADAPPNPFGSGRHRRRSPVAIPAGAVPDTSFPGRPAGCGRGADWV